MPDRIRVVVAGTGTGEEAEGLARALRDAGVEVVYAGVRQTPEQVVRTVVQEDADAVGICDADATMVARTVELLEENDAADVVVFGDGIDDILTWVGTTSRPAEP